MASWSRRAAASSLTLIGIGISASALWLLPLSPGAVIGPLATHCVHLLAAFLVGRLILGIPGAAPREVLDLVVSATALGLAFLALVDLLMAGIGLTRWFTPWLTDLLAIGIGLLRARATWERITRARTEFGLSFVVAGRVPLYALLVVLVVPLVVPPFMPATAESGARALALPTQAAVRSDLRAAVRQLPGEVATPSTALLLHGQLSAGHSGARLFPLTFVALILAGAFLHGRRHLGPRGGPWSAALVASAPLTLLIASRDPSSAWIALYGFLAFHEVSDWCERATGGKIAMAAIYAGLAIAESPRGATLLAALLVFLFVVEAFVEGHGLLRQVPGVVGMALIALIAAGPFVVLDAWIAGGNPVVRVLARAGVHAPADAQTDAGVLPSLAPDAALARGAPLGLDITTADLAVDSPLVLPLLEVGPLLLGLLLLLPLASGAPGVVRQGVIALALAGLAWAAPDQWGTALGALGPLAICAAAVPLASAARGSPPRTLLQLLVAFAVPASVLVSLHLGPDVLAGAQVVTGRLSAQSFLAERLPDADILRAITRRPDIEGESILIVGDLTVCHLSIPASRAIPAALADPELAAAALRDAHHTLVAVELASPEAAAAAPGLNALRSLGVFGPGARHELFAVPEKSARRRP